MQTYARYCTCACKRRTKLVSDELLHVNAELDASIQETTRYTAKNQRETCVHTLARTCDHRADRRWRVRAVVNIWRDILPLSHPSFLPAVGRYRNFSRGCPRTRVPAPRFRSMPASLFFELTFHGSELRDDSMRQLLLCSIVRHALGYGYSECVVWRTRVRENDQVYAVVLNWRYKRKIQGDSMNRNKTKIEEEKIALEASLLPLPPRLRCW